MSKPENLYPFVIQEHRDGEGVHWDLMLHRPRESNDPDDKVLATWRLAVAPTSENLSRRLSAVALPDHRRAYLTYQGPISHGRGHCQIFDQGLYEPIESHPDFWHIRLTGRRLSGRFILKKLHAPDQWELDLSVL